MPRWYHAADHFYPRIGSASEHKAPQDRYRPITVRNRDVIGDPVPDRGQRKLSILHDLHREMQHDNVVIVSAGVAFYAVLAILPALILAISLYGIFTSPSQAERQIASLLVVLPEAVEGTLVTQMRTIAATSRASLSLGFVASIAFLLWTVSNATRAMVRAVKIAYDQETQRSRLEGRWASLALTVAVMIGTIIALSLVAAVPIWLQRFDPTEVIVTFGNLRWLALTAGSAFTVGLLYRYAPAQKPESWRDVVPGVVAATALWAASSMGFSVYVSSYGSYNATYGALGAAVVLLLWFWFTALAVVFGAELNEVLRLHRLDRHVE
ncbi:MAG: YihY/virulence factor BrkB family protein [Actinomycetota bacterium]